MEYRDERVFSCKIFHDLYPPYERRRFPSFVLSGWMSQRFSDLCVANVAFMPSPEWIEVLGTGLRAVLPSAWQPFRQRKVAKREPVLRLTGVYYASGAPFSRTGPVTISAQLSAAST